MIWHIRQWQLEDIKQFCIIWNEIIESGNYYMGEMPLTAADMVTLCQGQTAVRCIVDEQGTVGGFYILHPNQIGRGGHIANATYAVKEGLRGCGLGRKLVADSLHQAYAYGFKGFQFNAVVGSNEFAIRLYEKLGFNIVGTVPDAFRLKNGKYEELKIMFRHLTGDN